MDTYLMAVIEQAAVRAAVESGQPAEILAARGDLPRAIVAGGVLDEIQTAGRWRLEEERFLRRSIGRMTDAEIGAVLGRTEAAIKIRRQRKGMPAHSKRPGWLTGHGAARLLGVDIHNIMMLCERELIPYERIPGERGILALRKRVLYRWAVNPLNWIYFRRETVRDRKLRRLIELRAARWNDEWWTPGQVAAWHGTDDRLVNKRIHAGEIRAVRWGNWWVLRSEATRPGLYFVSGRGQATDQWSLEEDGFYLLGRALGLSYAELARLGRRRGYQAVEYRLKCLKRWGEVETVLDKLGLVGVHYRASDGALWADWREYAGRFRRLGRAMGRFERYLAGDRSALPEKLPKGVYDEDLSLVRGVLRSWAAWWWTDAEGRELARRLAYALMARAGRLAEVWEQMNLKFGIVNLELGDQ